MKTRSIEQTYFFAVSPERVYEAYTNPEKHAAFTGDEAGGRPEPGHEFNAYGDYITGKYLELVKDKKIVQEWQTAEWPEGYPPSKLTITLEPSDKGTLLTMIHTDVPDSQAETYRQGWIEYYWEPMEEYFRDNA
jgi:uncharacterized protein YndB with AHSA1/START domain